MITGLALEVGYSELVVAFASTARLVCWVYATQTFSFAEIANEGLPGTNQITGILNPAAISRKPESCDNEMMHLEETLVVVQCDLR